MIGLDIHNSYVTQKIFTVKCRYTFKKGIPLHTSLNYSGCEPDIAGCRSTAQGGNRRSFWFLAPILFPTLLFIIPLHLPIFLIDV